MNKNNDYIVKKYKFETQKKKHIYSDSFYYILIVTTGSCMCHWEDHSQLCTPDNMIVIKPGVHVYLDYAGGKYPLEILQIGFSPAILETLSNDDVDLEASFNVVPYTCIVIRATSQLTMLIKTLAQNLIIIPNNPEKFAASLYEHGLITLLVVLIIRACIYTENHHNAKKRKSFLLDDVFLFIHAHLTEDLSLDLLEQTFYVSKYHISREFKRQTGTTIYQYIIKAKLDLCKQLILQDKPIIEVYKLCGFGGYNHLFRAFKKEFGITPKEFYRQSKKL